MDAFSPSDDFLISALVEAGTDCTGCDVEKQFRTIETWFKKLGFSFGCGFTRGYRVVCWIVLGEME